MDKILSGLVFLCVIGLTRTVTGQEVQDKLFEYPAGISASYGFGKYAVTDEYISKEKYSGNLPYFDLTWSRMHESYGYRLRFMYRGSSDIKNYNVSTEIVEAALSNAYLYPIAPVKVFGNNLFLYLGPTSEFYLYNNQPKIAVSGFDYAQSFAGLLSAGAMMEAFYPLNADLQIEGSFGCALLSLGLRMVDSEEDDTSPAKLLTFVAGTHGNFTLGIRYRVAGSMSIRADYLLQFTRISSWDPLLGISDNLIATLSYEY
jgi:hypothetical protein